MGVEKFERVMWRLRMMNPDIKIVSNADLKRAIILEVGSDPRTLKHTRKTLIFLGWLKTQGRNRVYMTGKDLDSV